MHSINIREPLLSDQEIFLAAMQKSKTFYHPWVSVPITSQEFKKYIDRYSTPTHRSYLVCDEQNQLLGVFNLSEIVRGCFQNAYLGFYAVEDFAGKGYMSAGLKLVLKQSFSELGLHRVETNIQPDNIASINLVNANGFRKEGYSQNYLKIDGKWRDHERWAMTYEDWVNVEKLNF